jgi:hypothetical protein
MHQSSRLITVIVLAAITASVTAGFAEGALLQFSFNGRQTTGEIVFNDSIFDSNPDASKGQYLGAIVRFDVIINGTPQTETGLPVFDAIHGSSGSIIVGLSGSGIGSCGLGVDCLAFLLGSNVFPPTDPSNFDLTFTYPAGSLLSDAIPSAVPPAGQAILRTNVRQFFLGTNAPASVSPVPFLVSEPSTSSLLVISPVLLTLLNYKRSTLQIKWYNTRSNFPMQPTAFGGG